MKSLKNIDFKGLFINHGEKMGFGLIGLFVLLALAKTSWSRTEKTTPADISAKVKNIKDQITSPTNVWPADKAAQYSVVDYTDKARQIFTPLNVAKYDFSTPIYHPLYRKQEQAREPEFKPVEYLISEADVAILAVSPTGGAGGNKGAAMAAAAGTSSGNSGFNPPAAHGESGIPAMPTTMFGAQGAGGSHGMAGEAMGMPNNPYGMDPSGTGGMMMGGVTTGASPRGVRFVSVRGVFPLQDQIRKYQQALNVSLTEARASFQILDFKLERQEAEPGPNPWSGKWEPVNLDIALDVLNEASDFATDPIPPKLFDPVITMSLPSRLAGKWDQHASHPNVDNFKLKPEEMLALKRHEDAVRDAYEKNQLASQPKVKQGGLSRGQLDLRRMSQELQSASASGTMPGMTDPQMAGNRRGGTGNLATITESFTASDRLLLFRYFDFDVSPGKAYRYRVKLSIFNPNFDKPVETVLEKSFTEGAERWSDWSNVSNPSVVPESINYFLKDVERDPNRDSQSKVKPVASIAMFQWDPKLGTMLADTLKIPNLGSFIGEKKPKATVLDVSTQTMEEKEVIFTTEDMLLDAIADLDLLAVDHPDLKITKSGTGKKDNKAGLLASAVVVDASGRLRDLDSQSDKDREAELQKSVEDERKPYKEAAARPKQTNAANPYAAMSHGGGDGGQAAAAGAMGTPKRSGRKPTTSGSSSGPPGMPGMGGAAEAHAGSGGGKKKR